MAMHSAQMPPKLEPPNAERAGSDVTPYVDCAQGMTCAYATCMPAHIVSNTFDLRHASIEV
jgi:hypothetical protein